MSLLTTLARLEAHRSGRAEPLATVRHRHLTDRPMLLVPLADAGEAGAPLAFLLGRDREEPTLLTLPRPLDRERRFALLAELADVLLPYLESCAESVELVERQVKNPETGERETEARELCADAPQLIVPNSGGIELLGMLGRATRFRRTAEDPDPGPYPAPLRVPLLGRWLTHLHERAQVPGSSLLLSMTSLLGRHWATGQSNLEDQHLGSLLGWLDPPEGVRGDAAALAAETERDARGRLRCPPAGPTTDPAFDRQLEQAVHRYNAARELGDQAASAAREQDIRELLGSVLYPVWEQLWQGLDLLRALPPGERTVERWEGDRWSYTGHRDRLAAGEPPQPVHDDAVTAARKLAQREREQVRLEVQEALDDPLVMAEYRLAGEAFTGVVTAVEPAYDTSGRSPKPRPLVTVRTDDRPYADRGRKLHRAGGPSSQQAELAEADPASGTLTVRLLNGMGRKREPAPGSVPEVGERVTFTLFELSARTSAPLPDAEETPWTHGGPPQ